jgi:hypothetical protein
VTLVIQFSQKRSHNFFTVLHSQSLKSPDVETSHTSSGFPQIGSHNHPSAKLLILSFVLDGNQNIDYKPADYRNKSLSSTPGYHSNQ